MKILLYGLNFARELTRIDKYTGELAAWLAVNWVDISAFSHVAAFSDVIADLIRNPWCMDPGSRPG